MTKHLGFDCNSYIASVEMRNILMPDSGAHSASSGGHQLFICLKRLCLIVIHPWKMEACPSWYRGPARRSPLAALRCVKW